MLLQKADTKKQIISTLALLFFILFSGCTISENPDQENFEREYETPDFSEEEAKVLNGETL